MQSWGQLLRGNKHLKSNFHLKQLKKNFNSRNILELFLQVKPQQF
jgi:hypothetical protein